MSLKPTFLETKLRSFLNWEYPLPLNKKITEDLGQYHVK